METDPNLYEAIWGLYKAVDYLGRAKDHLEELEHPALGDIERLIERLREEQGLLTGKLPEDL